MSDMPTNKDIDWQRLQPAFDALIVALHLKHTHARDCRGCARCQDVAHKAQRALAQYETALRDVVG